jgi:16S rRNA (guanine527-N7)-methyltransferase
LIISAREKESKLEKYLELLMSWVGKIRLTGSKTEEELREHIQEALCILPYLPETSNEGIIRIIDVGTGGGLPGIVLAISRPDIRFTLLDSIRKKCMAVEKMCEDLELKNTMVVCERAEVYANSAAKNVRASFDVVTARAVAATPQLLEWLFQFPKKGGLIIAPKGPKYREEIASISDKTLTKLKLSKPEIIRYGPDTRENFLLIWKKL